VTVCLGDRCQVAEQDVAASATTIPVVFTDLAPGTYAMEVRVSGVTVFAGEVTIRMGETTQVPVVLGSVATPGNGGGNPNNPGGFPSNPNNPGNGGNAGNNGGGNPSSAPQVPVTTLPATGDGPLAPVGSYLILMIGALLFLTFGVVTWKRRHQE
jgi:hypothetical protein